MKADQNAHRADVTPAFQTRARRGRLFTRFCTVVAAGMLTASAVAPSQATPAAADRCDGGPGWEFTSDEFDNSYGRHAFVGNGYLSQQVPPAGMGYAQTGEETGFPLFTPRFDGAFTAGLYSVAPTKQSSVPRRAIAAIPTWSTLEVQQGAHKYSPDVSPKQVSNFRQTLNVRCGLLRTSLTWTTPDGRATDLEYQVLADRANPHVGAVRLKMTPHWSGPAQVVDRIDGAGARRVQPTGSGADENTIHVGFSTDGVGVNGAVASTLQAGPSAKVREHHHRADGLTAEHAVDFQVEPGHTYEFAKFVGVDTRRRDASTAVRFSRDAAERGWGNVFATHAEQWSRLWRSDVRVVGRPQLQDALRSTNYALLSSIREGQASSVAPAGLSSDNYAGLIFWDTELWMYPNLLLAHPEIARNIIDYRVTTLPAARRNAQSIGEKGAFYPWTSADTGDVYADCHSWDPPHCLTQNHLQSDVGFAMWQYYLATGDRQWLRHDGWPVLQAVAEYWAGRVRVNRDGSYSVANVAGPDEYSNGVTDGVFTNAGAAMALTRATEAARLIGETAPPRWEQIAEHLRIPFDQSHKVFMQYDGYRDSTIKQADSVLLQYPLEWPMSREAATNTLDFYAPRTDPDGPAMTDAVHAIDAAATGEPGCATNTYLDRSVLPYLRAPFAQLSETRDDSGSARTGPPAFSFLTGGGGFTQVFTFGLTGLRLRADGIVVDPMLPPQLADGVEVANLHWQGRTFDIAIGPQTTQVSLRDGEPFTVHATDGDHVVSAQEPLVLQTRRPDLTPTSDVARCRPATATSEEPGRYAEAAVDGNNATSWAPNGTAGSLTVDLGQPRQLTKIATTWTDVAPSSLRLFTSVDGEHFSETGTELTPPRLARYVKLEVTGPAQQHVGLRELVVTDRS
ncbi:trehalose or maltose hydrolase [Mycobacterium marinum M]|uniref:Trehalose or maltose hydrolase n=1 Tax=Mycobacterium marinum (strain ATCC BAA-535 / M) TaxID=216594 RepID=B2HKT6_MYCMM|nr:discoidin domain-containing protein [Mycobacterium marinum]ACC40357.1 trehalose or maltose hydrolase [Mycobacterium marinum M]QQW35104.1 discoidin domain-containing protein [Mycobacterium marinum]